MKKPAWPKIVHDGPIALEIHRRGSGAKTYYVVSDLKKARNESKRSAIQPGSKTVAKVRANARVDIFKLSAPLRDIDWKFYDLQEGEHHQVWLWEAKRQVLGEGRAWFDFQARQSKTAAAQAPSKNAPDKEWLKFIASGNLPPQKEELPADYRKRAAQSYINRPQQSPVYEVKGSFDKIPKKKAGYLLLPLEIDCGYGIEHILEWVKKRLQNDPAFKSARKRSGGRLNTESYETWLYRLAMTRIVHAYGNDKAREVSKEYWKRNIEPDELEKCRIETMKRLAKMKSQWKW